MDHGHGLNSAKARVHFDEPNRKYRLLPITQKKTLLAEEHRHQCAMEANAILKRLRLQWLSLLTRLHLRHIARENLSSKN